MSHLLHFVLENTFACLPLHDVVKSLAVRYAQGLKVGGNNRIPAELEPSDNASTRTRPPAAQGKSDSLQIPRTVANDLLLSLAKLKIVRFSIN